MGDLSSEERSRGLVQAADLQSLRREREYESGHKGVAVGVTARGIIRRPGAVDGKRAGSDVFKRF